jgi:hypothetical protein
VKAVNERFDVRGSDLATIVVCRSDSGGKVSRTGASSSRGVYLRRYSTTLSG